MERVALFDEQDAGAYAAWLEHHARGYVLNLNPRRPMLHTARCFHLYPASWYERPTKLPKLCSEDRAELERWALEHGYEVVFCSTCKMEQQQV
jgi:hypothetical protein